MVCSEPVVLGEEEALLISRYVIEDNNEETIKLRPFTSAENSVVRSRLKYIIGNVHIFEGDELALVSKQVTEVRIADN